MMSFPQHCAVCNERWSFNHECPKPPRNRLPTIDPSMIPKTKSDRNLPHAASGDPSACAICRSYACAGGCATPGGIQFSPRTTFGPAPRAHNHYFKDVSKLQTIDVYRVLALFAVTDPCLQHAVKKLLVAGGRGGGKDITRDIQEAIDTLARWQEMRTEEAAS